MTEELPSRIYSNGDEISSENGAPPLKKSSPRLVIASVAVSLILVAITGLVSLSLLRKPISSNHSVAVVPSTPHELSGHALESAISDQEEKMEVWPRIFKAIENTKRLEPYIKALNQKANDRLYLESSIWNLNEITGESLYSYAWQSDPKNDKLKKLHEKFIETKNKISIEKFQKSGDDGPAILALQDEIQILQVQFEYEIHNLYAVLRVRLDQADLEYRRAFTIALTQGALKNASSCGIDLLSYEEVQKYYDIDMNRLAELKAIQLRENAEVYPPVKH